MSCFILVDVTARLTLEVTLRDDRAAFKDHIKLEHLVELNPDVVVFYEGCVQAASLSYLCFDGALPVAPDLEISAHFSVH